MYNEAFTLKDDLRDILEYLFLDWTNNFLSISTFAQYYGISENFAKNLINEAREQREERLKIGGKNELYE